MLLRFVPPHRFLPHRRALDQTPPPSATSDASTLLAVARLAVRVSGLVVTHERLILLYFACASAATFAPAYLVSRMVHAATGWRILGIVAGALVVCVLVPLLRLVYGDRLGLLRKSLGSFDDMAARREALRAAVESAASVERLAARLHVEDQLAEWGSCSALDDGVEELVDAWRTMWMELRRPAAVSGPYPPGVLRYVQHVEGVFTAAMQPDVIASAVSRLLRTYVERSSTAPCRKEDSGLYDPAFVGVALRFNCRSNLDWAMLHAWHLTGSPMLAASKRVDFLRDPRDLAEEARAVFLSWWDAPRHGRVAHLPYDTALLYAPMHVLAVRATDLEAEPAAYPVSLSLAPYTPANGAPTEYMIRLWQVATGTSRMIRPDLDRLAATARRLARRSPRPERTGFPVSFRPVR